MTFQPGQRSPGAQMHAVAERQMRRSAAGNVKPVRVRPNPRIPVGRREQEQNSSPLSERHTAKLIRTGEGPAEAAGRRPQSKGLVIGIRDQVGLCPKLLPFTLILAEKTNRTLQR